MYAERDQRRKEEADSWLQQQNMVTRKMDDLLMAMEAVHLQDDTYTHSLEYQAVRLEREERLREVHEYNENKKAEEELREFEANCDFKLVLNLKGQLECVGGRWATQVEDDRLEGPTSRDVTRRPSLGSFLTTRRPKYKDHNWMAERGHTRRPLQRYHEALNKRVRPESGVQHEHGADGM